VESDEEEQPSFRSGRSKQSRKPVDDAIELEDIEVKKKGDKKSRPQKGNNEDDLEMQSQSSRRKKPTKKKK